MQGGSDFSTIHISSNLNTHTWLNFLCTGKCGGMECLRQDIKPSIRNVTKLLFANLLKLKN